METCGVEQQQWSGLHPIGYVMNRGGPHGLDTRKNIFGVIRDPLCIRGCSLVLAKFLDGTLISLRYKDADIYIENLG